MKSTYKLTIPDTFGLLKTLQATCQGCNFGGAVIEPVRISPSSCAGRPPFGECHRSLNEGGFMLLVHAHTPPPLSLVQGQMLRRRAFLLVVAVGHALGSSLKEQWVLLCNEI